MHKARNTNFFYDLDDGPHQLLAVSLTQNDEIESWFTGCSIQEEKKVAHPAQSNFFVHKSSFHCIFLKSLGLEILLSSFKQIIFFGQKNVVLKQCAVASSFGIQRKESRGFSGP